MRTSTGALVGVSFLLLQATVAHAQESGLTSGSPRQGLGGFRVGEGLFLRASVAAEAGYDTNVFYNDQTRTESAILNVTPSLELTNAGRDNKKPPLHFSLGVTLAYREYLTEETTVKEQRAFNPTISGSLAYTSGGNSIGIADSFTRLEEPPYQPGLPPIIRNNNQGTLQYGSAPGGGRIRGVVTYLNTLDLFENTELEYADRMTHNLGVDASWKWLPKTALFMQAGIGYVNYFDPAAESKGKVNSYPYQIIGGLRGLVTPKITMVLSAGFGDAIYDSDLINPSGLSNLALSVGITYAPTQSTGLGLGYGHSFVDSPVLGSYYDLDTVSLRISQQVADFVLSGFSRWEYRRYKGFQGALEPPESRIVVDRSDHIFQTGAQLDYYIQRWFYAGVGYAHLINRSSVAGTSSSAEQVAGLDFTKHLIVGRLGLKY